MKHLSLLFILSLLIFSCRGDKKKIDHITRLVAEWQGKEIVFPDNPIFTRYQTDTTDYRIPESEYKVLIYIDSMGCTSCKLQLPRWKELIAYTDSVTGGTVPFLFFFHPKDMKEISYLLKREGFDFPICIDLQDELNKRNQFPPDITFQTFLLNKENKVVVIGNPIHNLAVKELYLKRITDGKSLSSNRLKTTVKVQQTEIDLGSFSQTEKKKATFSITNTGRNPLVIIDAATTCGCTSAKFDKRPIPSGETAQVEVEISPKDTGFFSETITIKCNTDQHIKLTIRGQAL
ncbi:MAG: DUF1573 domain-containing protein [Tannerellaceae bacterium]|nr:DUF1573 domain-containing protein [Tannerellaceae bacterium]